MDTVTIEVMRYDPARDTAPRPQRYQAHEAERLRLDLQNWEPEAPVFMHTDTYSVFHTT